MRMSKEEAIDWLARVKSNTVNHTLEMPLWWNEPLAEALDMAIKALERQPCEDTISRQAAVDALRVAYWDDNIQSAKDDPCIVDAMTDWAIRQVKALPLAQPESLVNESRPLVKDTINRQAEIDALQGRK